MLMPGRVTGERAQSPLVSFRGLDGPEDAETDSRLASPLYGTLWIANTGPGALGPRLPLPCEGRLSRR
jgi:hypothetical protein